jgi:Tc toxin complex TcA C-terminal TcB-binding domain/Neuraminidase-like domain
MATDLQQLINKLARHAKSVDREEFLPTATVLKRAVELMASRRGAFRAVAILARDRLARFEEEPASREWLAIQDISIPAAEFDASSEEAGTERAVDFYASLFAANDGSKLSKQKLTQLLRRLIAAFESEGNHEVTVKRKSGPDDKEPKPVVKIVVNLERLDRLQGWTIAISQPTDSEGNAKFDASGIEDPALPLFRWAVEDPRDKTILHADAKSYVLAELPKEIILEAAEYQPDSEFKLIASPFENIAKNFGSHDAAEKQWLLEQAAAGNPTKFAAFIGMYWADKLKDLKKIPTEGGEIPIFKDPDHVPDTLVQYYYALVRSTVLLHTSYTDLFDFTDSITVEMDQLDLLLRAALIDAKALQSAIQPRQAGSDQHPIVPPIVDANIDDLRAAHDAFSDDFKSYARRVFENKRAAEWKQLRDSTNILRDLEALVKALSTDQLGGVWAAIDRFASLLKSSYAFDRLGSGDGTRPKSAWSGLKAICCLTNDDLAKYLGPAAIAVTSDGEGQKPANFKRQLAFISRNDLRDLVARLLDVEEDDRASLVGRHIGADMLHSVLADQYPVESYLADWAAHQVEDPRPVGSTTTAVISERVVGALRKADASIRPKDIQCIAQDIGGDLNSPDEVKDFVAKKLSAHVALARLTRTFALGSALEERKLTNASQIIAYGEHRLVDELVDGAGPNAISVEQVRRAVARARTIHLAKNMLVGEFAALRHGIGIPAVRGFPLVPDHAAPHDGADKVQGHPPDLESLFRMTDSCQCRPCESIHGAGAYLVDVLEFLKQRAIEPIDDCVEGRHVRIDNARDLLFSRLPDLKYIDLTCANAETPLPYIDLVCEALEGAISGSIDVNVSTRVDIKDGDTLGKPDYADLLKCLLALSIRVTPKAKFHGMRCGSDDDCEVFFLRDDHAVLRFRRPCSCNAKWDVIQLRQTTLTEAELAAEPEYVQGQVYERTANVPYGYKLPFDLGDSSVTALLGLVGSTRLELRKVVEFESSTYLSKSADILGLDPVMAAVIAGSTRNEELGFWQHGGASVISSGKATVDAFLRHCELSYAELLRLTRTNYLGRHSGLHIIRETDSCDLKKKHWVMWQPSCDCHKADTLTECELRTSRFLRLWKSLGWTIEQLDRALSGKRFGNVNLNEATLASLARFSQLRQRLNLSVDDLLVFFGTIPLTSERDDVPSMYWKLFLDPRSNGFGDKSDQSLLARLAPENVARERDQLSDVETILSVCFGLTIKDYRFVVSEVVAPRGSTALSFENLARIRSAVLLRRALQLPWYDYFALLRLFNREDEFASPEATWRFVRLYDSLRESGQVTPSKLCYFILGEIASGDPAGIRELQIKTDAFWGFLQDLCKNLHGISALPTPDDELQNTLGQRLASELLSTVVWAGVDRLAGAIEQERAEASARGEVCNLPSSEMLASYKPDVLAVLDGHKPRVPDSQWEKWAEGLTSVFGPLLAWVGIDGKKTISGIKSDLLDVAKNPSGSQPAAMVRIALALLVPLDRKASSIERDDQLEAAVAAYLGIERERAATLLDGLHLESPSSPTLRTVLLTLMEIDPGALPATPEQLDGILGSTCAKGDAICDKLHNLWRAAWKLSKVSRFSADIALDDATVRWILEMDQSARDQLGWLSPDQLPALDANLKQIVITPGDATKAAVARWRQLVAGCAIIRDYPPVSSAKRAAVEVSFRDVFDHALALLPKDALDASKPTDTLLDLASIMVRLTGWPDEMLQNLLARQVSRDREAWPPTDLADDLTPLLQPRYYRHLACAVDTLRKSGLRLKEVIQLLDDRQPSQGRASQLRKLIKKRFDEAPWQAAVKAGQDVIRGRKRAALVAYLVGSCRHFESADYIYAYYLIDPEMGACMGSSRIVQAHGAVQLFVQRCLMGLEQQVRIPPSHARDWEQWTWMKYFRYWEAARKIFLYPENWLEPELRDDKSEFFVEFENEINQNSLTKENLENAVINYLHKLNAVARLNVCASYYEFDEQEPILHVLARTSGEPRRYFYRRWVAERYWTPWETVDLEITGDHPILFLRGGRLNLAWATFTLAEERPNVIKAPKERGEVIADAKPKAQWKIQLSVSQYADQKWLAKQVTPDGLMYPKSVVDLEKNYPPQWFRLAFHDTPFPEIQVSYVGVCSGEGDKRKCLNPEVPPPVADQIIGSFVLTTCSGNPEAKPIGDPRNYSVYPQFVRSKVDAQTFLEVEHTENKQWGDALVLIEGQGNDAYRKVLEQTPGLFTTAVPRQASHIDLGLGVVKVASSSNGPAPQSGSIGAILPFFYSDRSVSAVFRLELPRSTVSQQTITAPHPATAVTFARALGRLEAFLGDPERRQQIHIIAKDGESKQKALAALFKGLVTAKDGTPILSELFALIALVASSAQDKTNHYLAASRFYHPLACELVELIYSGGLDRLYERSVQCSQVSQSGVPVPELSIEGDQWHEAVVFDERDAYSSYNWEIFFHIPYLVAMQLSTAGQYEDALVWFHYIFNPAGVSSVGEECPKHGDRSASARYWITKPFFDMTNEKYLRERIETLLDPASWTDSSWIPYLSDLARSILDWREHPAVPHLVARHRWVAFQKAVVYRYIESLINWADAKFRQFQRETIVEATQLYILASKLLGPRPRGDVPRNDWSPQNYAQVGPCIAQYDQRLYDALNEIEILTGGIASNQQVAPHLNFYSGYFCIPQNEKLLSLWDRVEDRLYKIRHCQDIDGVERVLALFSPPIDPGLLVRAAAAGLSVDQLMASLSAPPPHYRFVFMHQKATEFAQEVRALGNELLQVVEKRDAESLAGLRSELEIKLLRATTDVRKYQIEEAARQIKAIDNNIATVQARADWYESRQRISGKEQTSLDLTQLAMVFRVSSQALQALAGASHLIPDVTVGASGFGGSPHVVVKYGGSQVGPSVSAFASVLGVLGDISQTQANVTATLASYERRKDDWDFQAALAKKEIAQLRTQRAAAETRLAIAERELKNHDLQIENAQKIDEYLRMKFSNTKLYDWMVRQVSATYFTTYQLALDLARKAEQCLERELPADKPVTYVQPGYWDSLRKGLLAANGLLLDLKRVEAAYIERNRRGPELTKHVSLASFDPMQLVALRSSGTCKIAIPEELFDLDHPGQYRRRLKTVSLSLPCVAGPYTTISCRLTLKRSQVRVQEKRSGADGELVEDTIPVRQIATSSGQNDAGVFELNLRDERYLPFEGAGAISWWQLELPGSEKNKATNVRQFEYDSISDAILHLRYTASECTPATTAVVEEKLAKQIKEMALAAGQKGLWTMISLRHDMPDLYNQFNANSQIKLRLTTAVLSFLQQKLAGELPSAMRVGISGSGSIDALNKLKFHDHYPDKPIMMGGMAIAELSSDDIKSCFKDGVDVSWSSKDAKPSDLMFFLGTQANA